MSETDKSHSGTQLKSVSYSHEELCRCLWCPHSFHLVTQLSPKACLGLTTRITTLSRPMGEERTWRIFKGVIWGPVLEGPYISILTLHWPGLGTWLYVAAGGMEISSSVCSGRR